ncbi:MAG: SGNH/GDSL hydrolase family protein [Solirubrobacterales bacterium]
MDMATVPARLRSRALALAALALAIAATRAIAAPATASYVALGDSYAAGPLVPNPVLPLGCLKSSNNYPRLAAPAIGQPLRDATCSGAKTTHMTQPQNVDPDGPNPPQFNRLDAGTQVVSLTIGGNDIGFSEILQRCITWNPFDRVCQRRYVVNGVDTISQRISATAPLVDAVLDGIRARSPQARTFVVNYPAIFPETGYGCFPQMPVAFGDVGYLRNKQRELNQMLVTQAAANGARLVNWYAASIGHDACKGSSTRWVEPLIPGNWAASVHPNRNGMQGGANALVAAVNQP